MHLLEHLQANLAPIEQKLGYHFKKKELLVLALTHRSFVNESRFTGIEHNERLEFLGDSVLGLVIADYLFHRLPSDPEGKLSHLRSRLVDANACAQFLQKLGLTDAVLLGRGERMSEGQAKVSIQADVFEALVGALYLDGGTVMVKEFILHHFQSQIEQVIDFPPRNYKAELQDYAQRKFQRAPVYKVVHETGPDHAKIFHVIVFVSDAEAGSGIGPSKKEAEQLAAFNALVKMGKP